MRRIICTGISAQPLPPTYYPQAARTYVTPRRSVLGAGFSEPRWIGRLGWRQPFRRQDAKIC
jgi:hypothetical protein